MESASAVAKAPATSPGCRSSWFASMPWKTAEVTASATAPAVTRIIASTPAAIPAFSRGIASIAAVDIGA